MQTQTPDGAAISDTTESKAAVWCLSDSREENRCKPIGSSASDRSSDTRVGPEGKGNELDRRASVYTSRR